MTFTTAQDVGGLPARSQVESGAGGARRTISPADPSNVGGWRQSTRATTESARAGWPRRADPVHALLPTSAVQAAPSPSSQPDPERLTLSTVAHQLRLLEARVSHLEDRMHAAIDRVPRGRRESVRNLVHYLALRQWDLRDLQSQLAQLGLSSLGRSESCVRASLLEVSRRVQEALALRGESRAALELERLDAQARRAISWPSARITLGHNTRRILGPHPADRRVYIMVTAPSADEAGRTWMSKMLGASMDVLRVNCAHEGPDEWRRVLEALAEARRETGKHCRVVMDLAGPKIRTGAIGGPRVATWKPAKNEIGVVTSSARVVVGRPGAPAGAESAATLRLDEALIAMARSGDELRFCDARGRKRSLEVAEVSVRGELVCAGARRAYVLDRTRVRLWRGKRSVAEAVFRVTGAGAAIDVRAGDELVLTARRREGIGPGRDASGRVVCRGVVSCTLPAALDNLEVGHRVLFDDGRVETVVESARKNGRDFVLRVVRTQKATFKLRAEKGINLPDTRLTIPALTDDDLRALAFVVEHADAVSLSFVRQTSDIRQLHEALDRLGRPDLGVVLKIETRAGFENLPRLLIEGLRRPGLAVMIARGDLAVEVGFERLAELQEEILWLCEASHVPTIWATQVLDTLAHTGAPSRAEVTDAAASVAAECVMLNKGPFVQRAVEVLADILRRMEKHRDKKRSLYRKLHVSTSLGAPAPTSESSPSRRAHGRRATLSTPSRWCEKRS